METFTTDAQIPENTMSTLIIEETIRTLMGSVGADMASPDILATPARFVKAFKEMTSGYQIKPEECLCTVFKAPNDDMVIVKNIEYTSLCEHHLLPFTGRVHVGYLPSENIVGLSKIPRLVQCLSKRLQTQERLAFEIASTINKVLKPKGIAVVCQGIHSCLRHRGAKDSTASMVTSCMLGSLRSGDSKAEFLSLIQSTN